MTLLEVIQGAGDLCGLVPGVSLQNEQAASLVRAINRAVDEALRGSFSWPFLERTEEFYYAPAWVVNLTGNTQAVEGELYWALNEDGEAAYYTALRDQDGPTLRDLGAYFGSDSYGDDSTQWYFTVDPDSPGVSVGDIVQDEAGGRGIVLVVNETLPQIGIVVKNADGFAPQGGTDLYRVMNPWEDSFVWEEATDWTRAVPFAQDRQTTIDAVLSAHDCDPRRVRRAPERKYRIQGSGSGKLCVLGTDAPTSVWLRVRVKRYDFTLREWVATEDVAAGKVRYLPESDDDDGSGQCYVARVAIEGDAGNDAPSEDPDNWELVDVPDDWARYLQYRAAADYLSGDGADGQGMTYRGDAQRALNYAMADYAQNQQQTAGYTAGNSQS